MGQFLHESATTTAAVRRAIQGSQESLRGLARRYGVNEMIIAKWKRCGHVTDLKTGPKKPRSTVLSLEQKSVMVAFRRHTLLPLDDETNYPPTSSVALLASRSLMATAEGPSQEDQEMESVTRIPPVDPQKVGQHPHHVNRKTHCCKTS